MIKRNKIFVIIFLFCFGALIECIKIKNIKGIILFGLINFLLLFIFYKKFKGNKKNIKYNQTISDMKEWELERTKNQKEYSRTLSNLEKSEQIINYTYNNIFTHEYMSYRGVLDFIKSMEFKERMFYVINSCNKVNPTKKEQFLLALAYSRLGTLYNNYSIYYLELYLKDNKYYIKEIPGCNNKIEIINYQNTMFNLILSTKYEEDLEYDKALRHAFMSKGMNDTYPKYGDSYLQISNILYKKSDYKNAIINLNEAIRKCNDINKKNDYQKIINKYNQQKDKGFIYKPRKIKRLRLDMNENITYDLTTGEIIK